MESTKQAVSTPNLMKNKPNLYINIGNEEIAEAKKRQIIVQDTETQDNVEL